MLREAGEQWAAALGDAPVCFRPGSFSTNASTFSVLASLGFRSGSVSQPGRCAPGICAVWTGADRSVHRAHRAFRSVAGALDFVEVPVTTSTAVTEHWTGTGDTRFEGCEVKQVLAGVDDHLQWQIDHAAPLKHLCFFTHNFVSYRDGEPESRLRVLRGGVERLPEALGRRGMEPRGCTVTLAAENL